MPDLAHYPGLQKTLWSAEVVEFCSETHCGLQVKDMESQGRQHKCAAAPTVLEGKL